MDCMQSQQYPFFLQSLQVFVGADIFFWFFDGLRRRRRERVGLKKNEHLIKVRDDTENILMENLEIIDVKCEH